MGVQGTEKKRTVHSEINVTPLVDVMLVLLVIFMVTAPMLKQGFDVKLPETAASGVETTSEPFILTIKVNRKIYLGKTEIKFKKLSLKLKAIFSKRRNKKIYIHADRKVTYGLLARVMGEIRRAGIYQISLITIPRGKK